MRIGTWYFLLPPFPPTQRASRAISIEEIPKKLLAWEDTRQYYAWDSSTEVGLKESRTRGQS